VSFFATVAQPSESVRYRHQAAVSARTFTKLRQGGIRLLLHQPIQTIKSGTLERSSTPTRVPPRRISACLSASLKKPTNPSRGYAEFLGDFLTFQLPRVASRYHTVPKIHRIS